MHDVLADIMTDYEAASEEEQRFLQEQLLVLKAMGDSCLEEWLLFEEKLGQVMAIIRQHAGESTFEPEGEESAAATAAASAISLEEPQQEEFVQAQGYYKLSMFDRAAGKLNELIRRHPDFLLARIYLAMSHLQLGHHGEAMRQFLFLLPLTDNGRVKAISYTAMGCIHVENDNLEQALECFKQAYLEDPACVEGSVVGQVGKRLM